MVGNKVKASVRSAVDSSSPFGAPVRRVEDDRLTTGTGRYIDDMKVPGMYYARIVRSQVARASISQVRFQEDADVPADAFLFTGADVRGLGLKGDVDVPAWQRSVQPLLADDEVKYVGEPVAVVLHPDPYVAEDLADLVEIDYDIKDAVVDLASALGGDSPLVHAHWKDNVFIQRDAAFGDIDSAREACDHVVRLVTRTHRQAGVSLEGRGAIAVPEAGGQKVTLWDSTQVPHVVRGALADVLERPESVFRVVAPDVGGGFGVKGHVFPEEVLVVWLALRLGRPVKWIEDRVEHLIASIHARDHLHVVEAYVTNEGRILGIKGQFVVDAGAYSFYPWTAGSDAGMVPKVLLTVYDIGALQVEDISVATNKCPIGTYRGVGRPSATFTMERILEQTAQDLGLDPVDVRRINLVKEFPYTNVTGLLYDPGSYEESFDLVREKIGYDAIKAAQTATPVDARYRTGVGLAVYNEQTAHGTADFEPRRIPMGTGYQSASVEMSPTGTVTVTTGLQSHGQGMETTMAQIAADQLGIAMDQIRVVHGDTANSPFSAGTWGSRGGVLGGTAVATAAGEIRDKIMQIAAHNLECDPTDLVLAGGTVSVVGSPDVSVTVKEIAHWALIRPAHLPDGMAPGLQAASFADGPPRGTFSNSSHAAVVEVDTETGKVRLVRYVVVEDCGTAINPTIVEGQVHGGVVQGIGTALLEESSYSVDGQPLSSTFMDYLLPTASDVPEIEVHHLETPSPWTKYGMKGLGESGAIGPLPAIGNAVSDAIGRPVNVTPLTMARVWGLLKDLPDPEVDWEGWVAQPALAPFWR